jgi:hypothetical protein
MSHWSACNAVCVVPVESVVGAVMIETIAVSLGSSMESGGGFVDNYFQPLVSLASPPGASQT